MDLGAFSVSLPVADLDPSRAFYERLGFAVTGGAADDGWLIVRNRETTLGLFHGMFDTSMLTFNPGLDGRNLSFLEDFDDVRAIESALLDAGIELSQRTEPGSAGAGHIALADPDGNPILVDQFDMPDGVDGLAPEELPPPPMPLDLGPFTYSLWVADVDVSRRFYERLGFVEVAHGGDDERWVALRNGDAVLSLHHGAESPNTLTFNPGLDHVTREATHDPFTTVEEIGSVLIGRGLTADRSHVPAGARAIGFLDPDGNPVLIHQLH